MTASGNSNIEHACRSLTIQTKGQGFYGLGAELARCLTEMHAKTGLLSVFIAHTSASLCVQENADPDVLLDLASALNKFAPEEAPYRHCSEGPDDMPAHIKTLLTTASLSLPVREGRLALGTWQEVYLIEHRTAAHRRRLEIDFIGGTGI
ncbi:MAG: YjbQ family protein [Rhodomicrobium sp.]|nr:YjbQ family protein [Rhodomicrobium sp.]